MKRNILIIASSGGHWLQAKILTSKIGENHLNYITTNTNPVKGRNIYYVQNASKSNFLLVIFMSLQILILLFKLKPKCIISTGAAPGAIGVILGRLLGSKTIWVDSIANSTQLSLSGKIAYNFSDKFLTQWEELVTDRILYKGNIL